DESGARLWHAWIAYVSDRRTNGRRDDRNGRNGTLAVPACRKSAKQKSRQTTRWRHHLDAVDKPLLLLSRREHLVVGVGAPAPRGYGIPLVPGGSFGILRHEQQPRVDHETAGP